MRVVRIWFCPILITSTETSPSTPGSSLFVCCSPRKGIPLSFPYFLTYPLLALSIPLLSLSVLLFLSSVQSLSFAEY